MTMGTQISTEYQLLLAGFDYDGVRLDLYGNQEGEVLGIALPGQRVDIVDVLRDEVVQAAQLAVDTAVRIKHQNAIDQIEFERTLARSCRCAA
jgi:hypothetical protein